jgi:cation diffusion facilitator family transporter
MPPLSQTSHIRWPITLSIFAAVLTIGMKGAAYAITGSVGLFSDALESIVNLLAATTAYIALGYASRPADKTHAFGHEKIEYFSSGLEGVLIMLTGVGAAIYAARRLIQPETLNHLAIGTLIVVVATAVNLVVARVLLYHGQKNRSIVLEADGKHLMADVWTSIGVLVGLSLVIFTGLTWLDPVIAIIVGLNIVRTGAELVVRSFNGLMDHALSDTEQQQIRNVILSTLPETATFHLLRTRRGGTRRFAEFHLLVDGDLNVRAAHHLAHQVEEALTRAIPGLEVTIHIEPVDERDSWERDELKHLEDPTEPERIG